MKLRLGYCALVFGLALSMPARLAAQSAEVSGIEVDAGLGWFGGARFAQVSATEGTFGGGRRAVFKTSSEFESSAGADVRVGIPLTPRVQVETSVGLNVVRLSTHISDDVEAVPNTTASEPVTQYRVEGGLVVSLSRWRTGRLAPFATAGVGYLRQLNEGRTLVETGQSYYVGGGAYCLLTSGRSGWVRSAGLRADVRMAMHEGGVTLGRGRRVVPFVGGSVFVRF